jgi:hypothetical protein
MIRKLGLERTLQGGTGVDKRVRNLIEAMIIQRIIAPGSKLAFHCALAPATATSSLQDVRCHAVRSTRVSISLRSITKSMGLVRSASAPPSSALRFVSASP